MATALPKSRRLRAKKPRARPDAGEVLRRLNADIESRVRKGFGSPGLLPAGLIVLETTGRRSGKAHRAPLLTTVAPGGYLWISTVLGRRANWLQNARKNPDVRYWLKGRAHRGHALASAPGYALPDLSDLPPLVRWAASRSMKAAQALGFGVVMIVPGAAVGKA